MQRIRKGTTLISLSLGVGATAYFLLSRLNLIAPVSALPTVLCQSNCNSEAPVHSFTPADGETHLNANQPLPELLSAAANGTVDSQKISLLVEKSDYTLTVFYDLTPVKSYPVVFGYSPTGDKRAEGDRKTPEGIYRIHDLYPHPEWSKFLWLDYPTPQDWREHTQAKLDGEIPLTATIGGQIGIHGVPEGGDAMIDNRIDWTWGCIALKNAHVNEIYEAVTKGTIIEIVP